MSNQDYVSMAPPVNKFGHPPDVTVLTVFKETCVMCALRDSKELVARNAPIISKGMNVKNAPRGSRETVAKDVPLVSKEMNVNSALRGSREIIASTVHHVSKAIIVNNVREGSRVAIVYNVCRTTTELIVVMISVYLRSMKVNSENESLVIDFV